MGRVYVAVLHISDRTAAKLRHAHGIDPDEVRQAVVCTSGLSYWWNDDPERGLRALVTIAIRSRDVLVVLYPADDPLGDAWNLGSAYFLD